MMAARAVAKNVLAILFAFVSVLVLEKVEVSACNENIWIQKNGSIATPGFPNPYPENKNCSWIFRTSPGFRIIIEFNVFHLEYHTECSFDFVDIYDDTEGPLLDKLCGYHTSPFTIRSPTNVFHMIFHSDGSENYKGFNATYSTEFNTVVSDKTQFRKFFLDTRQRNTHDTSKWGTDITSAAVALFLDDPQYFGLYDEIGEKIAYELTLQLMSKLIMKKRISTNDLSHFIHAMTVACINPKEFFGVNLLAELRRRVDNSDFINPFFILVLCNAGGDIKMEDVRNLERLFHEQQPFWTDTQAMVIMALKCISKQKPGQVSDAIVAEMVSEIKRKQQNNGTVDNLKTTALVLQALIATESTQADFNFDLAIKSILKDMKYHPDMDIEEIYYFVPILRRKTLVDVNSKHCIKIIKTELDKMKKPRDHVDERIQVQTSVIIGNDMDFTRIWKTKVPLNFTLYQLLENISFSDPNFNVRYTVLKGKPYVSSLVGFHNSIEDGFFWFIYTKPLSSTDEPVLTKQSPVDIQVNETNELILWYRAGLRPGTQEVTTESPLI